MIRDTRADARGEPDKSVDAKTDAPQPVVSSAWSALATDAVPLHDGAKREEAAERDARLRLVVGRRRVWRS